MGIKSGAAIIVFLCGVLVFSVVSITYLVHLPYILDQEKLLNNKKKGLVLTDRNGEPFFFFNNRSDSEYVRLEGISANMTSAVISSEDDGFYSHPGISLEGIVRAMYLNLTDGDALYGGSTITQQLVKNTLLSSDRTVVRKVQEMLLALAIDRRYTKDQILEMYLNTAYFGEGIVGIEKAAERYYSKEPSELTLEESAYLSALLASPAALSPFSGDRSLGEKAQEGVLKKMRKDEVITESEYERAVAGKLAFHPSAEAINVNAPHFSLMIREKLLDLYGEKKLDQGLTVQTTLDLGMQRYAEDTVYNEIKKMRDSARASNGSVVIMNPTNGQILALVGSSDWFNESFGKVNMATSPRQPGSTFKPIVYALAFDQRIITPSTPLDDRPITFAGNYKPKDYDKRYRGTVQPRRALANSLNIPSVQVFERVGIDEMLVRAPDFGIHSLGNDTSDYGLSLVLGTGAVPLVEMVSAYSTLANEGKRSEPIMILSVKDKYGEEIYEEERGETEVISEQAAFLVSSILSDEKARAELFGSLLNVGFPVAIKTGTTENLRDAWTIGYTKDMVIGVWVGNNDNAQMRGISGTLAAGPIWKKLIQKYAQNRSGFSAPSGIVKADFCMNKGMNASTSAQFEEYFIEGTEPRIKSCIQPKRQMRNSSFTLSSPEPEDRNEEEPNEQAQTELEPPNSAPEEHQTRVGGQTPDPNQSDVNNDTQSENSEDKKEEKEEKSDSGND